jgi:hypothetical protein
MTGYDSSVTRLKITAGGYGSLSDSAALFLHSQDDATFPGIFSLYTTDGTNYFEAMRGLNDGKVNLLYGLQIEGIDQARSGKFVDYIGFPVAGPGLFDVDTYVAQSAWESIGPTGSGATNIWTTMDSVPDGADWVVLRIVGDTASLAYTAHDQIIVNAFARMTGTALTPTGYTQIAAGVAITDADGYGEAFCNTVHPVPLDANKRFDLYWGGNGETSSMAMYLVGYGFN